MSERVMVLLTLAAALGSGIVGGVLFAFSSFVMPGLKRLPPSQGIAAMQSINVTAICRSFMALFVGTAVVCAALVVVSLYDGRERAGLRIAGAALYLVGVLALTRLFHIPRNNALAELKADDAAAPAQWERYVASWTAGNHVRALAGAVAAAVLVWSVIGRP
jgi:uncharacterized membrane protein